MNMLDATAVLLVAKHGSAKGYDNGVVCAASAGDYGRDHGRRYGHSVGYTADVRSLKNADIVGPQPSPNESIMLVNSDTPGVIRRSAAGSSNDKDEK